ncbi:hypothetical protein NLU13_3664 [Sarocladium strictum]|uniref:Uncharacterized protein n=1 Tax=Sarocladium strictum TaxID=5046 RepID=A0AA39LA02_SARSR|nr:hypothetical protein NLU13_3664 [Sarocladium strictum]
MAKDSKVEVIMFENSTSWPDDLMKKPEGGRSLSLVGRAFPHNFKLKPTRTNTNDGELCEVMLLSGITTKLIVAKVDVEFTLSFSEALNSYAALHSHFQTGQSFVTPKKNIIQHYAPDLLKNFTAAAMSSTTQEREDLTLHTERNFGKTLVRIMLAGRDPWKISEERKKARLESLETAAASQTGEMPTRTIAAAPASTTGPPELSAEDVAAVNEAKSKVLNLVGAQAELADTPLYKLVSIPFEELEDLPSPFTEKELSDLARAAQKQILEAAVASPALEIKIPRVNPGGGEEEEEEEEGSTVQTKRRESEQPRVLHPNMTAEKAAKILALLDEFEESRPVGGVTGPPPSPTDPAVMALEADIASILTAATPSSKPEEEERGPRGLSSLMDPLTGEVHKFHDSMDDVDDAEPSSSAWAVPEHPEYAWWTTRDEEQAKPKVEISDEVKALLNSRIRVGPQILAPRGEECTSIDCGMHKTDLAIMLIAFITIGIVLIFALIYFPLKFGPRAWRAAKGKLCGRTTATTTTRQCGGGSGDAATPDDLESQSSFGSTVELIKKPTKAVRFAQV